MCCIVTKRADSLADTDVAIQTARIPLISWSDYQLIKHHGSDGHLSVFAGRAFLLHCHQVAEVLYFFQKSYHCHVTNWLLLFVQVLADLGMVPANAVPSILQQPTFTTVMLDGKVIGYIRTVNAPAIVSRLRDIKAARLGAEEMTPVGVKTIQLAVSLFTFMQDVSLYVLELL